MPRLRPRSDPAPRLIGSIAALIALAAAILAQVDPVLSLIRAAVSYLVASVATQLWQAFFRASPGETPVAMPVEPAASREPTPEKEAA